MAQVFKALRAQGMSLLVSSHILAELDEYSTHMLALDRGRVLEHRALGHAPGAGDGPAERLLRLEFLAPSEAVAPWLQARPGVRINRTEPHAVEIGFTGGVQAQAALVGDCVAAGHLPTVIAPITENLQQSYLKSLRAGRLGEKQARPVDNLQEASL